MVTALKFCSETVTGAMAYSASGVLRFTVTEQRSRVTVKNLWRKGRGHLPHNAFSGPARLARGSASYILLLAPHGVTGPITLADRLVEGWSA